MSLAISTFVVTGGLRCYILLVLTYKLGSKQVSHTACYGESPIIDTASLKDDLVTENIAKNLDADSTGPFDMTFLGRLQKKDKKELKFQESGLGYVEKAKELSFIYHDRPVTPSKELTHWVRHVIETHGAPHLRSPALQVPFYQKFYLDLLAVVLIIISIMVSMFKVTTYYVAKYKSLKQNTKKKI